MHLLLVLLNRVDQPERLVQRLRQFGVPEPQFLRARSTAAALSAEVPVFAGLRSLALGADEDRLIALSTLAPTGEDELKRLLTRLQLEMDADDPPMGKVFALPLLSGAG
jgi:hypothetical protein